jgi:hypothetical protein
MQTHVKRTLRIRAIATLSAICCIVTWVALRAAEPPRAAWQVEWEKTVKAAEQEGQITLYSNEGIEGSIKDFQSKFPKVKVVLVSGRAGQLV